MWTERVAVLKRGPRSVHPRRLHGGLGGRPDVPPGSSAVEVTLTRDELVEVTEVAVTP